MPQLLAMALPDETIELVEQLEARRSDSYFHHPPVFWSAVPFYEFPFFKSVKEPRHVRRARDQPGTEGQRRNRLRLSGPQQAKCVILLRRQVVLLEQPLFDGFEPVVRSPQVQVGFLLG